MKTKLNQISEQLRELLELMDTSEQQYTSVFDQIPSKNRNSAKNLIHYLSLRNQDIRELQIQLHEAGLSSLSISESHIKKQVESILERLGHVELNPSIIDSEYAKKIVREKSRKLFGKPAHKSLPALMVTLDSAHAQDFEYYKELLKAGMRVARINCAHDDEKTWLFMIGQVKKASSETGISCKIYMDLAGPKIRVVLIGKGKNKGKVTVEEGERVYLSYSAEAYKKTDIVISPGVEGILSKVKVGDRVYIDDGMIRCLVEKVDHRGAKMKITRISSLKKRIKAEKGINFPDTEIEVSPLTDYDISCLPFVCQHADIVGYSFVRKAEDLRGLNFLLQKLSSNPPPVIVKIETPEAFKNLPAILLEGLRSDAFGVMIARGDLAVEMGFERLVEVQEEILWICEAAHVPVVWATQVLETLNKSGIATRSEVTDAGHSSMAECVMLNKGDFTLKVLYALTDILKRQAEHRHKKSFTFRKLSIAKRFFSRAISK